MFEKFSAQAGKKQHLVPYFIAAHPGTTDEDMLNLALWLKKNDFRLDQVQTFLPTPMAPRARPHPQAAQGLPALARPGELAVCCARR